MHKLLLAKLFFTACIFAFTLSGCSAALQERPNDSRPIPPSEYQAKGYLNKSLPELISALDKGNLTSLELVESYLARIEKLDQQGPELRTIISLNPDALEIAKNMDRLRQQGNSLGRLHGIPILLKDNIESKDNMPTTAGALALKDNFTNQDSPLVAGLRAQGAIILGKTNLSQWANFRSESSMSGWSAIAGQVRNPHMLDRNPCGSSSGSGAATAASLAAASVGTETNGSIICPSTANGIVGFKPTVKLIPQDRIIPISATQDTAGPMTKSVMGSAIMMNAMANDRGKVDYTSKLKNSALKGVRVGVLRFAQGESKPIINLFNNALKDLQAAGAILVDIENQPKLPQDYWAKSYDLLKYEFKQGINDYLASTNTNQVSTRNLQQLIEFNQSHANTELALFDQSIFVASEKLGNLSEKNYLDALKLVPNASKNFIDDIMLENNVKVLVSPSGPLIPRIDPINGDVWPSDWPGAGSYAARAGYPHITVPMGAYRFLPLGLSMIASANQDSQVLAYAFAYEQYSKRRLSPRYFKTAEQVPNIKEAMTATKE